MWKNIFLTSAIIISIAIAGCGRKGVDTSVKDKSPVLAKIGKEVITLKEFDEKIKDLPDNIKSIVENNKAAYLDNLVAETLLYTEALKEKIDKDEEVKALLEEAKKRILIARLAKDEVDDKIIIDDKEIEDYYNDNIESMQKPELMRASHILVDTMEEAAEIIDKLNAGAIFEELARRYSKDVTRKRGGDVGYFSAGQMLPAFEDACLKLNIGEISGPVKTEFGYHIIKLTDKRGPEPMKLKDVRDKIEMVLKTQKRGRLLEDFVQKLKLESKVVLHAELLESKESNPEDTGKDTAEKDAEDESTL